MGFIDEFKIGDTFTVEHHKDCKYEVTGFWDGANLQWMDVKDLNGKALFPSTSFNETNLRAFEENKQIRMEAK